ncbi:hypothetical protein [Mycoplasmopsis columbinasalis]|uniref:Uncharacterized protein n=1 Tax=Mycoplasmopsis columbinasalis TaxID=114880 RepID=A0A449BA54_9BACT|nr:hypothetical protein [Mycoplasmopsis columbinasalis]VEU78072.1 Uncharacterised protein [Mycoplasmopsis columbinasalis]
MSKSDQEFFDEEELSIAERALNSFLKNENLVKKVKKIVENEILTANQKVREFNNENFLTELLKLRKQTSYDDLNFDTNGFLKYVSTTFKKAYYSLEDSMKRFFFCDLIIFPRNKTWYKNWFSKSTYYRKKLNYFNRFLSLYNLYAKAENKPIQ